MLVHDVAGALLQMCATATPGQSPSQASPRPSPSEFLCRSWAGSPPKFGVRTQLSALSNTPSASRSPAGLEQTKPWPRDLSHAPLPAAVQSAAVWHGPRAPPDGYEQVPAWSGL